MAKLRLSLPSAAVPRVGDPVAGNGAIAPSSVVPGPSDDTEEFPKVPDVLNAGELVGKAALDALGAGGTKPWGPNVRVNLKPWHRIDKATELMKGGRWTFLEPCRKRQRR